MQATVAGVRALRFSDGTPVRAASAVVEYDGGWLVAQDDATHGCLLPAHLGPGTPVRLLPPVEGHDTFDERRGTKHLKPDLEAAGPLGDGAVLLGSGSTPARVRAVLLVRSTTPRVVDLTPLYARVAAALGVEPEQLNLEGACALGPVLRWFHRGRPAAGLPSAAIDVPLDELRAALAGTLDARSVTLRDARAIDLGDGLAVTDAVALDGRTVLVSAAAEDSPNAYDDGPVLAAAVALLVDGRVAGRALLPEVGGRVAKVEGLAVRARDGDRIHLLATVDADDPELASSTLDLQVVL